MADEKIPAVKPSGIVKVQVINLDGYVPGVKTTFPARVAEELVKQKKVKVLGEAEVKVTKKAPEANKK